MLSADTSVFSNQQLKQAIEWFVQLQSENCSLKEQSSFENWLDLSESHRAAYTHAENIWANMDDLKFIPVPALKAARSATPLKSNIAKLASWVVFVLSATLISGAWLEYNAQTIIYVTRKGEHRRIELADNSFIDLNTDSSITVRMSLLQRKVNLAQGEAQFNVTHNQLRPFLVDVGDLTIRDVGTVFNVIKQGQKATISVLEGEVELNNDHNVNNEHLIAGDQRSYTQNKGLGPLQSVQVDKLKAWVNGDLFFKETPLLEVMTELERYHPVKFTFDDQNLAKETLSGTFNSDDLNPFLHALESMLPVQTKRKGQNVELHRVVR
ncbi:MAG: FecR domain-containing protein [Methylococcales bacterium]|jgi:transmembrane sensor|nr:FecR domain-containing protein [Methylococcales bacterium]